MSTSLVTLASRASQNGAIGTGHSQQPSIAGNGAYIAFESAATNLSGADQDQSPDIFRRQLTVIGSFAEGPPGVSLRAKGVVKALRPHSAILLTR